MAMCICLIFPTSLGAPNQQSNESDLCVLLVEMDLIRRVPPLILVIAPWQWHCDYPHFKENLGHREVTSIPLKVTNVHLAKLTAEAPGSGSHT